MGRQRKEKFLDISLNIHKGVVNINVTNFPKWVSCPAMKSLATSLRQRDSILPPWAYNIISTSLAKNWICYLHNYSGAKICTKNFEKIEKQLLFSQSVSFYIGNHLVDFCLHCKYTFYTKSTCIMSYQIHLKIQSNLLITRIAKWEWDYESSNHI